MFIGLFLFSFVTFIILTFIDSTDYISKHDLINWVDEGNEKYYGIGEQVKIFKRNDLNIGTFKVKRDTISAINTASTTPITKNASIMTIESNATLNKNKTVKLKAIASNKRKKRSNMRRSIQGTTAHKMKQTAKRKNTSKRRQTTKRKRTTKRRTTPKKKLTTKRRTTPKKKLTTKRRTTPKKKLTTKRRTTPKKKLTTKHKTTPRKKSTTKHITTPKKKSTTIRKTTPKEMLTITTIKTTPKEIPTITTIKTTTSSEKPSLGIDIDSLRTKYLNQTNYYRKLHGSPDLTKSEEIENRAQAYAEKLANEFSGQLIHDPDKTYGENLAYMPSAMIDDPVKLWYDEVKNYDFNNPGFGMNTGHFTQLVWKNTKEMGCGIGRINQKNNGFYYYIISCKYNPPGNYLDQFSENVLPEKN